MGSRARLLGRLGRHVRGKKGQQAALLAELLSTTDTAVTAARRDDVPLEVQIKKVWYIMSILVLSSSSCRLVYKSQACKRLWDAHVAMTHPQPGPPKSRPARAHRLSVCVGKAGRIGIKIFSARHSGVSG